MPKLAKLITTSALVLLLTACGGGGGGGGGGGSASPTAPPPPDVVMVDLNDFAFGPRQIEISPGTTVRFVLRGSNPDHTTTAKDGRWDSGFAFRGSGATFDVAFTQNDNGKTFEYFCETHKDTFDMKGSIRVGLDAPAPSAGY